ncbi:MAG: hypothetical protein OXI16_00705 [Chloroflexota bacterium]|nr:hypothetical protein [Chloroflexota bacterium]MDE2686008.1 hypothetical protein [Chloroflexota bacterium]
MAEALTGLSPDIARMIVITMLLAFGVIASATVVGYIGRKSDMGPFGKIALFIGAAFIGYLLLIGVCTALGY